MARYGTNESIILTDSAAPYVDYTLYANSALIFAGRAYKFPDAANIKIDITDICHSLVNPCYLDSETGSISYSGTSAYVTVYASGTYNADVYYFNDFTTSISQSNFLGNRVSTGYLDPNSWLYPYAANGWQIKKNGVGWQSSSVRTRQINLGSYSLNNGDRLEIVAGSETVHYTIKCGANYELYFPNQRGAIDTIPFYGPCTMRGSGSHYAIYNSGAFGPTINYKHIKENKATEGTVGWTLVTGPTKDAETGNIYELALCNKAWLRDMATDKLYAVNITNTDIEQKLRKKDSNTSYTINVELAQIINSRN